VRLPPRLGRVGRIVANAAPAWVVALAGVVAVALVAPADERTAWMPVVVALALLVVFVAQLPSAGGRQLQTRLSVSVAGLIVIVGAATAVFAALPAG